MIGTTFILLRRPSTSRDWSPDQKVMPSVAIRGDLVEVRNVRNFRYRSTSDFDLNYETRTYDISKLDSVWFIVERFGDIPGLAHTFLSFGFGDEYVAISAEIRKERGALYSPWKGLLREYELMYVIGDERDLIGLRTNHRRDLTYLYPVRTTPEKMRQVFLDMVRRADSLGKRPEFYNTLTNNCTTNIVSHVNTISPRRIPFSTRIVLPAYADSLAHEIGLIDSDLPLEKLRERHRIDPIAQRAGIDVRFSQVIRAGLHSTPTQP